MKNTTKILMALVQKDIPLSREELLNETGLSSGVLGGTIFFLQKRKLILTTHIPIKTPPWKHAEYSYNPEKGQIIVKLLKEEGVLK